MDRHPVTRTWQLPPSRAPLTGGLSRTNLRELAARPGRFEHHLVVVARVGDAQLEQATASEPLYFAHQNVSDEHALPLTTGDAMIDSFPFRVFLSDPGTLADVARINHRAGDLVLHPYGWLHWPGRLRPPFDPPPFPPGARRAVLSLVFCACTDTEPVDRGLGVTPGREDDAKAYVDPAPPLALCALGEAAPGVVARVGDAVLRIAEAPFAPARGGYVFVLDGEGEAFPCDLVHVPKGARYEGAGVRRALVFESDAIDADAPPASWTEVSAAPFAPFEDAPPGSLPLSIGAMSVRDAGPREVAIDIAGAVSQVPRYWLARMLFRIALHGYALGYVETYGGFFYDDRGGVYRLGVRGAGSVELARGELEPIVQSLYRAVAPEGYREDLR